MQMTLLMYAMDVTMSYDAAIVSSFQTVYHIRFVSVRKTSKTDKIDQRRIEITQNHNHNTRT